MPDVGPSGLDDGPASSLSHASVPSASGPSVGMVVAPADNSAMRAAEATSVLAGHRGESPQLFLRGRNSWAQP